jgi:thymidine phosphorylase
VLDVKFGRGAFMTDPDMAIFLASEMVHIGEAAGRRTVALVTAMDNPLGRAVGNALEVQEALDALAGAGDEELIEVSVRVAAEMCRLAGIDRDPAAAVRDGSGRARLEAMLAAQGGHLDQGLPVAPVQLPLPAPAAGHVAAIDALEVGLVALELGAGRRHKDDAVDHAAGLVIEAPVGAQVSAGAPLATIHAKSAGLAQKLAGRLAAAWRIVPDPARRAPHVYARVDRHGVTGG